MYGNEHVTPAIQLATKRVQVHFPKQRTARQANVLQRWAQAFITSHAAHRSIGHSNEAGRDAYRALFDEALRVEDMEEIRRYPQQQRAHGSEKLRLEVEALTQRATVARPLGRPRTNPSLHE